jgi:hypothetical protein
MPQFIGAFLISLLLIFKTLYLKGAIFFKNELNNIQNNKGPVYGVPSFISLENF